MLSPAVTIPLKQLARVADRVRRMPLHSPLAAVLAGVELTLRKAQDWEQHAHRGVSLKAELGSLSALVVRWRAVELESWPKLLDARERVFVLKVGYCVLVSNLFFCSRSFKSRCSISW